MAYFKDAQEGQPGDVDLGEADMDPEVPLTKPVFPRYRAMLEADGRSDLIEA